MNGRILRALALVGASTLLGAAPGFIQDAVGYELTESAIFSGGRDGVLGAATALRGSRAQDSHPLFPQSARPEPPFARTRAAESAVPGGTGVTLYEISERVSFDPDSGVIIRDATSPLLGFAELGSPLCPSALLVTVPRTESCTVIATGIDNVSTATGRGPVHGTFDVVINAPFNSSVHIPDLPVISGTFGGMVDLSLSVLQQVPLGFIEGTFTIERVADPATAVLVPLPQPVVLPFTGTFRLPFGIDDLGRTVKKSRGHAAFYLADDLRTRIPVRAEERSIGFPTVRLEVRFQQ